ncbi:hypothetical protein L7F22_056428 [Adiantum nelumboides]|nr:hypothetical protein [Adiantum nelumboides]
MMRNIGLNLIMWHSYADHSKTSHSIKLLREVWLDINKDTSERMQARLYNSMRDYLNGVALQANYRNNGVVPTVEEYMALRVASSGMFFFFILTEYGLGMELDEEALQNETLQKLIVVSNNQVSITNDLVSCHLELHRGDYFNLPAIIYSNDHECIRELIPATSMLINAAPGCCGCNDRRGQESFVDALECAKRMAEEEEKEWVRLAEELMKSELMKRKPVIEAYVRELGHWVSANKEWSPKTARYKQALLRATAPAGCETA